MTRGFCMKIEKNTKEYVEFDDLMVVAQRGYIDDTIDLETKRAVICCDLPMLNDKRDPQR